MRLIVKEYISRLKEKDELDILLQEIYVQKGYIADNDPKTGNRQYGVDVQLHNRKELLLLVVKQGDIDRQIWDGDINAVRPSLNEIHDVVINTLTYEDLKKQIRIVVATNGKIDEAVKENWQGYVNNNQVWNGIPIKIEFMGIDAIVEEILDKFFNEYLFEKEIHSLLRKSLYFIDEGDYKKYFHEKIVDSMIQKISMAGSKKKCDKACSSLYLASQMICQYADEVNNLKVAIEVSEYVIIKYWKYLFEKNLLGKKNSIEWLIKFLKSYESWNNKYVKKIERVIEKEIILPTYNVVENRVLLYELLGYLASYCNYLIDTNKEDHAKMVLNYIIELINQYDYFVYAPYDVSINVMIMIYRLLWHFERKEELILFVRNQTITLKNFYCYDRKFPAPTDTFEEAVEIEFNPESAIYDVSALWGYYLLILYYLDLGDLYELLHDFFKKHLEDVSKCVWFLRKKDEIMIYSPQAMYMAGEGIEVKIESDFDSFKDKANFLVIQYNDIFSFEEYSFTSLEMIICRYFDYIPRLNFFDSKHDEN